MKALDIPNAITEFKEEYFFLSNFYRTDIVISGVSFCTAENAFQAAKSMDMDFAREIAQLPPGTAKRRGRQIFLRPDWERTKLEAMGHILHRKFQNPLMRELLVKTSPKVLIEGNDWGDTYWGVDSETGKGFNHLGQLLMLERARIMGIH